MKILQTKKSFRAEFKRQIRLAITAAIGFTIAFAWRNAIFDSVLSFVSRALAVSENHYLTEIYAAIAVTIFGVFLITITSRFLGERRR